MAKLNLHAGSTDKKSMRTLLFFSLALALSATPVRAAPAPEPASCEEAKSEEATIRELETQRGSFVGLTDDDKNSIDNRITSYKIRLESKQAKCASDRTARTDKQKECAAKISSQPGLWKWNASAGTTGECEDARSEAKANTIEGECNNAELMKGENLKGEACKKTAGTIKDVTAQQESLTMAVTAGTTAYAQAQAMNTTGYQADVQTAQQNMLKNMAMAKMATAAVNLAGAGQLKAAAGNASEASSNISEAHSTLATLCQKSTEYDSNEQCFFANAKSVGIQADATEYANFERMQSAATQSQDQADKANAAAKVSMITGATDALMAWQAWQMSQQAAASAVGMGVVPPPPLPPGTPGYNLASTNPGGVPTGVQPTSPTGVPTDFGNGSDLGLGLNNGGGHMDNSIKGGKFALTPGTAPGKSTVSTSGAAGGGGPSGRNGGQSNAPPGKGGLKDKTGLADYELGGGVAGFKGGNAPNEKGDGTNPFAEVLAKMFPPGANGTPVVDGGRQLASDQIGDPEAFTGSDVVSADLSIFEQITSRYRKLAGQGSI